MNALKNLFLALFALIAIFIYYFVFDFHRESFQSVLVVYFFFASIVLASNIVVKMMSSESKTISFGVKDLSLYFIMNLLFVSLAVFSLSGMSAGLGLTLFFKSSLNLTLILAMWVIIGAVGYALIGKVIHDFFEDIASKALLSLAFGFVVLQAALFVLYALGAVSTVSIIAVFLAFALLSYKQLLALVQSVFSISFNEYEGNDTQSIVNISIDSTLYFLMTFLLSVNFVMVYRAFPIGWDDLGAYMNMPKIISQSGALEAFGSNYVWQLYTSIGYVFGSQSFAFYLSSFSGVLAAGALIVFIRTVLPQNLKSFDYSALGGVMLLMMPMTVFQLSKDMKLDFGLLFLSISLLVLVFGVIRNMPQLGESGIKNLQKYFLSWGGVGILLAICFAFKPTSLLLILAVFGLVFYTLLGFTGLISYILGFIGIFTLGNLWSMMNVVVPQSVLTQVFAVGSIFAGVILCIQGVMKGKSFGGLQILTKILGAILIGFVLGYAPFAAKNLYEMQSSEKETSVRNLIGGVATAYRFDPSLIYTEASELAEVEASKESRGLDSSGVTADADFGRYFGYEEGLNNYLKLFYNLSVQSNQSGEFTDITFVFLALFPIVFIFLPFRSRNAYLIIPVGYLLYLLYASGLDGGLLTDMFSLIHLPYGYFVLLALYLGSFVYFYSFLDRDNSRTKVFLCLYVLLLIYAGLWSIAAYGIVWYGIVMYALLITLVFVCILPDFIDEDTRLSEYLVLGIVGVYLVFSAVPHAFSNLSIAGFHNYKLGRISETESIFQTHPEYFPILLDTNIAPEMRAALLEEYKETLSESLIRSGIAKAENIEASMQSLQDMTSYLAFLDSLLELSIDESLKNDFEAVKEDLYNEIIYPKSEYKNDAIIYRLGTFMKYYISDNHQRLFEDNLLFEFHDYIYDEDPEISAERIQKLGVEGILVDLNSATIDQDDQKKLTQRYEELLTLFVSDKLELVTTDSVCLQLALSNYKKDSDMEAYIRLAGVNHNDASGMKKGACIIDILSKIQNGEISETSNSFLLPYSNYIMQNLNPEVSQEEATQYYGRLLNQVIPNGFKAYFTFID